MNREIYFAYSNGSSCRSISYYTTYLYIFSVKVHIFSYDIGSGKETFGHTFGYHRLGKPSFYIRFIVRFAG